MPEIYDLIIHNVHLASMSEKDNYGIVEKAVICIKNEKIAAIYRADDSTITQLETEDSIDGKGNWVTPGLVDCHSHIVYGGNRVNEFEMRLNGATYEELAKAGGGILSTVKATRETDIDDLFNASAKRLSYLIDEGVTYLEIKSGYGLDLETETKMLKVAQQLHDYSSVEVSKTFLGAHAVPTEYKDNADGYIDLVCNEMMPKLNELNLIDCVDAFCEGIGFSIEQTQQVFDKAASLGLPVKLHAEQLSNLGGSALASQYDAWSVDHLEYLTDEDTPKLKESNTVATLLPGAFYFLSETKLPPIEALRKNDVPIAIATDCNPGSSPCLSLLLMLNMATTLFKLTPLEALKGVTINAAKALNIDHKVGSVEVGKQADLVFWDIECPAQLSYQIGGNPCRKVVKKGALVLDKDG